MKILALDLSLSSSGWAVGSPGGRMAFGTITTSPKDTLAARYEQIWEAVFEKATLYEADWVAVEGLHVVRNVATTTKLAGLIGAVRLGFYQERKLDLLDFRPSEVRKAIGLKGNAKKEQVIAAVEALGYKPANDDEADAIATLLAALVLVKQK